ncbi:MAG TPA: hypothetical protein VJJ21_03405 [Candidatus Nanoarchaeia archaeon]|nr:hypothetical protein [Candidatus Nanoarchaeia archaeon]
MTLKLVLNAKNLIVKMIYYPETYYWYDEKFSTKKALLISLYVFMNWCDGYECYLLSSFKKDGKKNKDEKYKKGTLPRSLREKEKCIADLFSWATRHSLMPYYFRLYLYEDYNRKNQRILFNYIEGLSMWQLEIDEKQFKILQKELVKHKLPKDLFYPETEQVKVESKGLFSKTLKFFTDNGIYSHYSPREWQREKKAEKLKKGV